VVAQLIHINHQGWSRGWRWCQVGDYSRFGATALNRRPDPTGDAW